MDIDNKNNTSDIFQDDDRSSLPSTSTLRNTIKTNYKKTKAKLHSAGLGISDLTKRDRNEYENLDKSNTSQWDLRDSNFSILSCESNESYLKANPNTTAINEFVQQESVIQYTHNQSNSNINVSSFPAKATAPLYRNIPPTAIISDQERIRRERVWFLFFIFLYSMYLIVGGLCFQTIETPVVQNATIRMRTLKSAFLKKYPQIYDDDLEDFLSAVVTANNRGISPLHNASNEQNWSFGQALFFSTTVLTTIGYGNVTPLSQTGKIFCIIYASIGIPLTLVFVSAVVERLLIPANWLLGTLNAKLGHLYQPFNIRLLHLSLIVLLVILLFVAIPTAVFAYLEPEWGTLDAFYYCFISLTTVGLGDYIPGEGISPENRSLYKIFITAYLVLGLVAVMFALSVFYDIPQLNLGQLFTENLNGETEKLRLSGNNTTCYSGPSGLYMPQRDEEVRRAVVRIRPHGDDSPSPDDPPSSLNRDMRIP